MAETLILDRAEIQALVSSREALEPMRDAFRLYSTKRTVPHCGCPRRCLPRLRPMPA
jgi:hypothetical protein